MERDQQRISTSDIAASQRDDDTDGRNQDTMGERPDRDDVRGDAADDGTPLFSSEDSERLRGTWSDIQAGFVDEPKGSVERADALVAEVLKRVATTFSNSRASLEEQWARGEDASTEDLRLILRRYRSFFDRLLAA